MVAGYAAATVNALLLAYLALQFLRPGAVSTTPGPIAGVLGGLRAALLAPVALGRVYKVLALGEGMLAVLGAAAMSILSVSWFLVAGAALTPLEAVPVVAAATLLAG